MLRSYLLPSQGPRQLTMQETHPSDRAIRCWDYGMSQEDMNRLGLGMSEDLKALKRAIVG